MSFKEILSLIRVRQWYKNLIVYLAVIFSGHAVVFQDLLTTTLAFIALCLISSTNYIINDFRDIEKDKKHPEKATRPLAKGTISKETALFTALITFGGAIFIGNFINLTFTFTIILLFILAQAYTFFLKKIPLADILTIASFFVLRAIAGAFAINVWISPWLVLCPFFLSLFLTAGKRHSDLLLLKEKANLTRKSLKGYNRDITSSLLDISTTLLVVSYAFYSFSSEHLYLLYTLPIALYLIFYYLNLIKKGDTIARHPEKIVSKKTFLFVLLFWTIIVLLILYV